MGLLFEYSVGQRPAETPLFSIRNAKETDKIGDCALLLRKPSIPIGAGINKPPLIGLHGQTTDTVLFLLALAFEVLGLWLAHSMGGVSIVGVALVTVFFILVDVAAAVAFHRLRSGKTDWYVASAFAARQGQGGDEKDRGAARNRAVLCDRRVASRRLWSLIPAGVICVLALTKGFGFWSLMGNRVDIPTIAVFALYVATAGIHLLFTGYAIYAFFGNLKWNSAIRKAQIKSADREKPTDEIASGDQIFIMENGMPDPPPRVPYGSTEPVVEIKCERPFKTSGDGESVQGEYRIYFRDAPTDQEVLDLISLISQNAVETRRVVAALCLGKQLDAMSPPKGTAKWH